MRSRTTKRFRAAFDQLPIETQRQARRAYAHFKENPNHLSLQFKRVHNSLPVFSARISRD